MTQNIEQYVEQIFKSANLSSVPIDAENYFDLDFDWRPLHDVNIMAALSVAQKKIYMNERYARAWTLGFAPSLGVGAID